MNAISNASRMVRGTATAGTIALRIGKGILRGLRISLFSALRMLEIPVLVVLAAASFICAGTSVLYKLIAPPGVHFPHFEVWGFVGLLLVVVLVYQLLIRLLDPN